MFNMPLKTNPNISLFHEESKDDNFWRNMMAECSEIPVANTQTRKKRLLVLGDSEADKCLLISRLQGESTDSTYIPFMENGLEFTYLTVKDECGSPLTKLDTWILNNDPFFQPLLKYALDENSLSDTTVLLIASMTKPWDIFKTITASVDMLLKYVKNSKMPKSQFKMNETLKNLEGCGDPDHRLFNVFANSNENLLVNFGIEIVVVITRTECMQKLCDEFDYKEEHFDFLQVKLREFCLSQGAGLFYVSVKEDKNCDLLLKYLLHKMYSLSFEIPVVLTEPDGILVPAGWDSESKIKLLSDDMRTIRISTSLETVFKPFRLYNNPLEPGDLPLGDQEFLVELQLAMERTAAEERELKKRQAVKERALKACHVTEPRVLSTKSVSPSWKIDDWQNATHPTTAMQFETNSEEVPEEKMTSQQRDSVLLTYFQGLLSKKPILSCSTPVRPIKTARTVVDKKSQEISVTSGTPEEGNSINENSSKLTCKQGNPAERIVQNAVTHTASLDTDDLYEGRETNEGKVNGEE